MLVYESPEGLRIIRKVVEQHNEDSPRYGNGDIEAVKELAKANRHSIVPIFFSTDKNYYYELDLRPFGYQRINDIMNKYPKWWSEERRKRISLAVEQGLRFDRQFWFIHKHLRPWNILVRIDNKGEILDVKIVDFKYLIRVNVEEIPYLKAIRDREPLPKENVRLWYPDFSWMDLDGYDFSSREFIGGDFFGASLNRTNFSSTKFEATNFEYSNLEGASFVIALLLRVLLGAANFDRTDLYDTHFKDDITKASLLGTVNLNRAINLEHANFGFDTSNMSVRKILRKIKASIGDNAQLSVNGGIDLTSDKALSVQNNGQGIKFHIDPAMLQQLQNAPGFVPVIINIQPLKSLSAFLGINNQPQPQENLALK